jgi:hypothetical protein
MVADSDDVVALFIAAGTRYKAGPKRSAAEKRRLGRPALPPDEYVWRSDTLRLMFPERSHSVWLFWEGRGDLRRFVRYFVNLEEPFRRTPIGFDTQDHTLDAIVTPDLSWRWRDEDELRNHVTEEFYTPELAEAVWAEGRAAVDTLVRREHPACGWTTWLPDATWKLPVIDAAWCTSPVTRWPRSTWAYGDAP